jgi:hypothetical protein
VKSFQALIAVVFALLVGAQAVRPTSISFVPPVKAEGSGPLFRIYRGKWGYMDRAGRIVIPLQFDSASDFFDGLAAVSLNGRSGYINEAGAFTIPLQYESAGAFKDQRAVVTVNGKCGLIDLTGRFVADPQYSDIRPFSEGMAAVWVGAKQKSFGSNAVLIHGGYWGFIDRSGRVVIEPQFDWIESFSDGLAAAGFGGTRDANGEIFMMDGVKWGFINQQGTMVIAPEFDEVQSFTNGVAIVRSNAEKRSALIDRAGRTIRGYDLKDLGRFTGGLAPVRTDDGAGFINVRGDMAITADGWDFGTLSLKGMLPFSEGLMPVGRRDNLWGFVDQTGKLRIEPRFSWVKGFSEGLAGVRVGTRWGFMDSQGGMVLPPQFDDVGAFVDGLCLVKQGQVWNYIDKKGSVIATDVWTEH